MTSSSFALYSLAVQDIWSVTVKSSSTLVIAGEITILLICSFSLQLLHIDGIDLPGDFMTMISTHHGLYSVVQEISEHVTVLVGKSGS